MDWNERDGIRWLQAELPGARAAFTARLGGASEGAFASLNLGLLTDDEPERVHANRGAVMTAMGLQPSGIASGKQVHGTDVARQDQPAERSAWLLGADGEPAEVDGWVTAGVSVVPLVFVADCLPVALAGPRGVAMIHCGWRGLAGGIVERAVREVDAEAAAIGPGIGACCFEVGTEVLEEFSGLGDGIAAGRMLDLPEVAERLLASAGVERVERSGLCTCCENELFFSHRRDDGVTGRQVGLVRRCPS
ncbi:MAG: polyphenol oxidase family protein [Solirubrobacterales bacterium]